MTLMLNKVIKDTAWQFSRFITVGLSNAVIDFLVYIILTRSLIWWRDHYLLANAIAFIIANFNSFFWNRRWTFNINQGGLIKQYFQFLGVSVIYLGFIQFGLWLLVGWGGMYDLFAKIIVIVVGMVIYFSVLKRFIFFQHPTS